MEKSTKIGTFLKTEFMESAITENYGILWFWDIVVRNLKNPKKIINNFVYNPWMGWMSNTAPAGAQ